MTTATMLNEIHWQQDERVLRVRQRAEALNQEQLRLRRERDGLWREACANSEGVSRQPPPWHPVWQVHGHYETVAKQWHTADRERQTVEDQVRQELTPLGYDACFAVWRSDVVPVLEQLSTALQRLEQVSADAQMKTGAVIGGLGHVTMTPVALKEWIAVVEKRGTFGSAGG